MSERQDGPRVGVHRVSWMPTSPGEIQDDPPGFLREALFTSPEQIVERAKKAGADFVVHLPGYYDLFVPPERIYRLRDDIAAVDEQWWMDRRIELRAPLKSEQGIVSKMAISTIFSLPFMDKHLTRKVITALPGTPLINRWARFSASRIDDPDSRSRIEAANEVLGNYSPIKEVLDVHSTAIGLTSGEILEWMRGDDGVSRRHVDRRLMVSALLMDERLPLHHIPLPAQERLIRPLLPHVSFVNLKVTPLTDVRGNVIMTKEEVVDGVMRQDYATPYATQLNNFSQQVGKEANHQVEWVVKVKGDELINTSGQQVPREEFLPAFVQYVRNSLAS